MINTQELSREEKLKETPSTGGMYSAHFEIMGECTRYNIKKIESVGEIVRVTIEDQFSAVQEAGPKKFTREEIQNYVEEYRKSAGSLFDPKWLMLNFLEKHGMLEE